MSTKLQATEQNAYNAVQKHIGRTGGTLSQASFSYGYLYGYLSSAVRTAKTIAEVRATARGLERAWTEHIAKGALADDISSNRAGFDDNKTCEYCGLPGCERPKHRFTIEQHGDRFRVMHPQLQGRYVAETETRERAQAFIDKTWRNGR